MAETKYARLIEGASRVTGAAYAKADVPGDFWVELTDFPMPGDAPVPGQPGKFARATAPDLVGGASRSVTISAAFGGGGLPVAAPVLVIAPAISGAAQVGQTLTASDGTWTGTGITYARVWRLDGAIVSTSLTYKPITADIGKTLAVTVTATNAGGSVSATSGATSAVIAAAPAGAILNVAAPLVAGEMNPGFALTLADSGIWTQDGAQIVPDEVDVIWERRSEATPSASIASISGATGQSYLQRESDHAYMIYANIAIRKGSVWSPYVRSAGMRCSKVSYGGWFGGGGWRNAKHFENITGRKLRWVKDGLTPTSWGAFQSSAFDALGLWVSNGMGRTPDNDRHFVLNVPLVAEWSGVTSGSARSPAGAAPYDKIGQGDANVSIGWGLRYTYQNYNTVSATVSAVDVAADTIAVPQAFYDATANGDRLTFTSTGTNPTISGASAPLAATDYSYAFKAGGNLLKLYTSPNSAVGGAALGLRNIGTAGSGTITVNRGRFEDANGVPLEITDIDHPSDFVRNYIRQAVTNTMTNTIFGKAVTLPDGTKDYANSTGYSVIKLRLGHEMNGNWYTWAAWPNYEAAHKYCARFMLKTWWERAAEVILADHSAHLIAEYGAANATTALIAAKKLFRPCFCANKNAPSGALIHTFWWGDDVMAGGTKPDGTFAYPPGDVTLDLYNDRWYDKFLSTENLPMTGDNLTRYLQDRAWRESKDRADRIDYFVRAMVGKTIPQMVADGYDKPDRGGFCLAWLDDFTADQTGRPGGMAPGRTIPGLAFNKGLSEYAGGERLQNATPRGGSGDDEVYYELIHRWLDGTLHTWLAAEVNVVLSHWGVGRIAEAESGCWGISEADYKTTFVLSTIFPNIIRNGGYLWNADSGYVQIDSDPIRHVPGAFIEERANLRTYSETDKVKDGLVIAAAGPFLTEGEFPRRLLGEQVNSGLRWCRDWMPEAFRRMLRTPTPLNTPNMVIPTAFGVARGKRNQLPFRMNHAGKRFTEVFVNISDASVDSATGAVVPEIGAANNIFTVAEVDAHRVTTGTTDYHLVVNKRQSMEAGVTQFTPYGAAHAIDACVTVATAAAVGKKIKVVFSDPANVTLNGGVAPVECVATIVDGFSIADVSVVKGSSSATLTISRAAHNGLASKVTWKAVPVPRPTGLVTAGTSLAVSGSDFTPASGEVQFSATDLTKQISVPIAPNGPTAEPKEFWVFISVPAGEPGAILDNFATVTVATNVAAPAYVSAPGTVGAWDMGQASLFTAPSNFGTLAPVAGTVALKAPYIGNTPAAPAIISPWTVPVMSFNRDDDPTQSDMLWDLTSPIANSPIEDIFQGRDPSFMFVAAFQPTDTGTGYVFGAARGISSTNFQRIGLLRQPTHVTPTAASQLVMRWNNSSAVNLALAPIKNDNLAAMAIHHHQGVTRAVFTTRDTDGTRTTTKINEAAAQNQIINPSDVAADYFTEMALGVSASRSAGSTLPAYFVSSTGGFHGRHSFLSVGTGLKDGAPLPFSDLEAIVAALVAAKFPA